MISSGDSLRLPWAGSVDCASCQALFAVFFFNSRNSANWFRNSL
jgi:hypothetical protein